jgi:hypothetical protein
MMKNSIGMTILAALVLAGGSCAPVAETGLTHVMIGNPIPAIPFYHVRAAIRFEEKGPFEIQSVSANGRPITHFEVRDIEGRLIENKPYPYTWPLFAADKIKEFEFQNPWLIARLDWEKGKTYDLEVVIQRAGEPTPHTWTSQVKAPESGGYWDPRWAYYKSIVVTEDFGLDRTDEPIEFSLVFYPDQITDLEKELRIVRLDSRGGATVLPSQTYEIRSYLEEDVERRDEDGTVRPLYWLPTVHAKVVVPMTLKADRSAVLLAFYGNPESEKPENSGGLRISGEGLGITVANDSYSVKLHPDSGMLDEIRLQNGPDVTLLHKLETNGAIHWNPDAYSPPRPWVHASDWNPPEEYRFVDGPVMFALHRKGVMPDMPEIALGITYKFFADSPYFLMTSYMEILEEIPLQTLRNAEVVLDHKLIDSAAWLEPSSKVPRQIRLASVPLLTEIHLPLDTRWMSFFHTGTKIAFGGIPMESSKAGLNLEPLTCNPYFYIIRGPWVYWTRALLAPYMTQNIQQIIPVPAGNVYWEKWAYLPYVLGEGPARFQPLSDLEMRLSRPLRISVVDERDPRVRIPDEIYTDPTKTGWEEL